MIPKLKKISSKQKSKNESLLKIKKSLLNEGNYCRICMSSNKSLDLAHILPKSIFPEYYTEPKNLTLLCRCCHDQFDNSKTNRKLQSNLYHQVSSFDKLSADRYFGMNE